MRGLRVKDAQTLSDIISSSFDQGILVLKAGKNTLRFLPPLTITKNEIDEAIKLYERALYHCDFSDSKIGFEQTEEQIQSVSFPRALTISIRLYSSYLSHRYVFVFCYDV